MQQHSDWWPRCAFIRDYFFGDQQKVAQQLAAYLAENFVGDEVSELRPDTDVSALVAASIRASIDNDDVTITLDEDLFSAVDLRESVSFKQFVSLVQSKR